MFGPYDNEFGYGKLRIAVIDNDSSIGVIIGKKMENGNYIAYSILADNDGYVFGVDHGVHSTKPDEHGAESANCLLTRGYCSYNGRTASPDEIIRKLFDE